MAMILVSQWSHWSVSVYPAWFYFLNMLQAVNQLRPSAWGYFGPLYPKTGTACLSSTPDASIRHTGEKPA